MVFLLRKKRARNRFRNKEEIASAKKPDHGRQSTNEMNDIYVYVLQDPAGEVRYVGVTVNPEERLRAHLNASKRETTYKSRWIRKLMRLGQTPTMTVIQTVPVSCWVEAERYWIFYFKSAVCHLTNTTVGGEGVLGLKMSQESKGLMSKRATERFIREAAERAKIKRCPICDSPRYSSIVRCPVCLSNKYHRNQGFAVDEECKRCHTITWIQASGQCKACLQEQGLKECAKCKNLLLEELDFSKRRALCRDCDAALRRARRRTKA
jgi:hypothetical protein